MSIHVDRDYIHDEGLPLLRWYDGQSQPQPVYLCLDEDGEVYMDYNAEIGNSVPIAWWKNMRTLTWRIPGGHTLTAKGIDSLIEQCLPILKRVHENHVTKWDGSNMVGQLSSEGEEAYNEIEELVSDYYFLESLDCMDVSPAEEWTSTAWKEIVTEYREANDREAYLEGIKTDALSDGVYLVGMDALEKALELEINEEE